MAQATHPYAKSLANKISHIRFGMLTTVDAQGRLSSRPMTSQQVDDHGHLWFFTSDRSRVAECLTERPSVNVGFSKPDESLYVSVSGQAELVRNAAKEKELWNPLVGLWFPKGLEDPHLALIKVTIEFAEYWDAKSSKMVQLATLVKAALTGARPNEMGEHKKFEL